MKSNPYYTSMSDKLSQKNYLCVCRCVYLCVCVWILVDKTGTDCTNRTRSALTLGQLPVSPLMAEISVLNIDGDPRPPQEHFIPKSLQQPS